MRVTLYQVAPFVLGRRETDHEEHATENNKKKILMAHDFSTRNCLKFVLDITYTRVVLCVLRLKKKQVDLDLQFLL